MEGMCVCVCVIDGRRGRMCGGEVYKRVGLGRMIDGCGGVTSLMTEGRWVVVGSRRGGR